MTIDELEMMLGYQVDRELMEEIAAMPDTDRHRSDTPAVEMDDPTWTTPIKSVVRRRNMSALLEQLKNDDRDYLYPKEAGKILGMDGYKLNCMAKDGKLPFPFLLVGNRVKIMKGPFIKFVEGK